MNRLNVPLSDTLAVCLPAPLQTHFLRAALHAGEAACRAAWAAWAAAGPNLALRLSDERWGSRRLLPLLYHNLNARGVEVEPEALAVLKAARAREELRARTYLRISRPALAALAENGVAAIVLKGASLAGTVYPEPGLRHCHDVDLFVAEAEAPAALAALASAGFQAGQRQPLAGLGTTAARHESGMPVALHTRLFRFPHYAAPLAEMRARAVSASIAGVPSLVLSPADALVHVCGLAACSPSRQSLQWVTDASLIMAAHSDLDWDVVVGLTRRSRLAIPLALALGYLAEALDAPVPPRVIEQLRALAAHASAADVDAALAGARLGPRGSLRQLAQASGWRSRLALARWLLLPSPGYLRWAHPSYRPWLLPLYYLERPLGHAARRLASPFKRRPPPTPATTEQPALGDN